MTFQIKALDCFLEQVKGLDEKSKGIIRDKIELIKSDPFHFKRIHSKKFRRVFRVRLSLGGKETRLIYAVLEPNIILVCILERKNDYRDLEKYLAKIR